MNLKDYIVYEDENILLINKPRGALVQSDGSETIALDNLVKEYLPSLHTGPIHRLDKDTSGLVLFGKNDISLKELSNIFASKDNVEKHYLTLVSGQLDQEGEINAPIRKNFQLKKMVVAPLKSGAKEAITRFKVIKAYKDYSLLDVNLITGRTHQIRVHMSYIRHHVVGDTKYGDYKVNNYFKKEFNLVGQFLHSYSITFKSLKGKLSYLSNQTFECDLPKELNDILSKLL